MNLGELVDGLYELKRQKAEVNKTLKELNESITKTEHKVLNALKETGITMARGARSSAIISEEKIAQVTDWDSVYNWIYENNAGYIMQRRLNNAAWRELAEQGELIPGTEPFTRTSLSTRKI